VRPRAQQQQLAVSPESHNVLDDEYNKQMAEQMHWDRPFEYHFDRGEQLPKQYMAELIAESEWAGSRDYYAHLAQYGLVIPALSVNVFSAGLYFHEVAPGLCCGTQPRNPAELEQLAKGHGINVIVNLQQDKDMQHWGIDFEANQRKMQELGLRLIRKPVSTPLLYCCMSGWLSGAADKHTLTFACCWSL
jgi:hypothetical protein